MKKGDFREKKYSFREKNSSGFAEASRSFGERRNRSSEQNIIAWDEEKKVAGYKNVWQGEDEVPEQRKTSDNKLAENKEPDNKSYMDFNNSRNIKKKDKKVKVPTKRLEKKLEKYLNTKNPDMNSPEYQGESSSYETAQSLEQLQKPMKKTFSVAVVAAVKLVVNLLTTKIGIIALILSLAVTTVVMSLQTTTYDFIVDEEKMIRELMSNVLVEFNNDIQDKKLECECDVVISSGELAEWKEVIAFWWTIKMKISEHDQWENYFDGDDAEDLKYIFDEFNHIEYEVQDVKVDENTAGKKILKVNITNSTLEELEKEWALSDSQQMYLHKLIEDEEIWEDILGTSELARIAFDEIGNGHQKYVDWYDNETIYEKSSLFVAYCLAQIGCINEGFISVSENAFEFREQMKDIGFLKAKGNHKPKDGDIIFLNVNDEIKAGIISRVDGKNLYIAIIGYNGSSIVEEIALGETSGIIDSYARVENFIVTELINNGNAENVIRVALQFEGVTDDGNNNVIFNTDYYGHEVSGEKYQWCCAFVWDVFRMAGCSDAFYNGGKTAGCVEVQAWGKREGIIIPVEMAQPGDLILFDWEPNGIPNHIGILYNINSNGTMQTIEGNTGYGNNSNGGQVMVRTRYQKDIMCVIRPEY